MFVVINGFGGVDVTPLDVVRLLASSLGIKDVDVEPGIGTRVTIHSTLAPISGKDINDACLQFIRRVFK